MQYIIMITIVLGLALADIITGWIKAHVNDDYSSKVMRKGGLNKVGEIVIMTVFCGLEIGIRYLGQYYDSEILAKVTGGIAVVGAFFYISVMEMISILENYAESNPEAAVWIRPLLKKLRSYTDEDEEGKK
jgi:toxin secretion/phage lysis holin